METSVMRLFGTLLVALLLSLSTNLSGDIKSKKEIGAEAKSKAPHNSVQQFAEELVGDTDFSCWTFAQKRNSRPAT